jgi:hypothetical protein
MFALESLSKVHMSYTPFFSLSTLPCYHAVEAKTQNGTKSCGVILSFISIITAIGHIRKHIFFSSAKEGNRNIVCGGGGIPLERLRNKICLSPAPLILLHC